MNLRKPIAKSATLPTIIARRIGQNSSVRNPAPGRFGSGLIHRRQACLSCQRQAGVYLPVISEDMHGTMTGAGRDQYFTTVPVPIRPPQLIRRTCTSEMETLTTASPPSSAAEAFSRRSTCATVGSALKAVVLFTATLIS